jgi:hypothetical protein
LFKESARPDQKLEVKERLETAFEVYILLRKIAEFHDDTLHFLKRMATLDEAHNLDQKTLKYYYDNTGSIEINQNGTLQRVIFRESRNLATNDNFVVYFWFWFVSSSYALCLCLCMGMYGYLQAFRSFAHTSHRTRRNRYCEKLIDRHPVPR